MVLDELEDTLEYDVSENILKKILSDGMFSDKLKKILENVCFGELYYHRGLKFCILNDLKQARFWLKKAAKLKHPIANELLNELAKKGLRHEKKE